MLISKDQELIEYMNSIKDEPFLAIDTEFMREKTYYPQLCLIQIASSKGVALIDPLSLKSLLPLEQMLVNPKIVKVFHAGVQDLEIFYSLFKKQVAPLFDTQIAAAFLGLAGQIGYGQLVSDLMGVNLKKSDSFTDWSVRPLSESQTTYAQDDVVYLYKIYPQMRDELIKRGRMQWAADEFERSLDVRRFDIDYDTLFLKVKRISSLKPRSLAIAQQLAIWRERTAQKINKPRRWVLSDELVVEISRQAPQSINELKKTRSLPGLSQTFLLEILESIKRGRALPDDQLPHIEKKVKLSYKQELLVDLLMIFVKDCAKRNQLVPVQLALRSQIENHLLEGTRSEFLRGWRGELLGKDFCLIVEGKAGLKVTASGLSLVMTEGA